MDKNQTTSDFSQRFKRVNTTARQRAELLDATRWSNDFLWEDIEILAKHMDVYKVAKGTTLFEQGDRQLFMVLITEGQVEVLKEDSQHKFRVIARIGKEKTLGEMALIDSQPRSASALASEETTLFLLTKEAFEAMADESPKVWGMLLLKICKLMSMRLRATSGVLVDFLK